LKKATERKEGQGIKFTNQNSLFEIYFPFPFSDAVSIFECTAYNGKVISEK
jgi:hypothetical protein